MKSDPQDNLWQASSNERVVTQPLAADVSADLAVIGGGFTGCSAALQAASDGASVVLVEADTIGHGGSGRNVGLVNAGLWLPPDDIIAELGETTGLRLIETLSDGPDTVFSLIEREGIDCEATHAGTLHLAHSDRGLSDLNERFRQGNRLGAPLQLLDAAEATRRTGSEIYHGALLDPRAGTVQPLAYCKGRARAAQRAGAAIHEASPATAVARQDDTWHVTVNGHTIRAKALLLATNAYLQNLSVPYRPQFATVSFSQFATAPLSERQRASILPGGEGCWDTALVMSSFRMDRAGRLVVGGMGDLDGPGGGIHAAWGARKLRRIFPELAGINIEHQWCGKIAMTTDHIPKVIEFGPNGYAIFGYSGRGICPGTIFGMSAATALLENKPEAMPLAPTRDYRHRFASTASAYYEFGATLTHALRPVPFL